MDETQPECSSIAAELKIDVTLIAKLNLADFQNAVPLVRDLSLINETDQAHEQVELVLTSEVPFLKPRRWRIDALAAHSRHPIRDLDLNLGGGLLARLTEAETATISLTLCAAGAQASAPAFAQHDSYLELLPRNQWGGISHLPDLVAAFVQPNEPAVDRLLKQHRLDAAPGLRTEPGQPRRRVAARRERVGCRRGLEGRWPRHQGHQGLGSDRGRGLVHVLVCQVPDVERPGRAQRAVARKPGRAPPVGHAARPLPAWRAVSAGARTGSALRPQAGVLPLAGRLLAIVGRA